MSYRSINPANGEQLAEYPLWSATQLETALAQADTAQRDWSQRPLDARAALLQRAAGVLRARREELAGLISLEMGKLWREALAEVDKCALVCDYYAEQGPGFLADELLPSDASRSLVCYQPLGVVLAVMPWNFPFWQVFRFAAPALMAGNTGVLKHASNVPQCALAIESVFAEAGFPEGCFRTLMISAQQVKGVIEDRRIAAATLTGSEPAGRAVAATAGAMLKKCVLELGGSDPFIVLDDADLELAVEQAVASRFMNSGQSCIAAKRFILLETIADEFVERFAERVQALQPGDPLDESTSLAPLARDDLRDALHQQVQASIAKGAKLICGGQPLARPGAYYAATILDQITPAQPAWDEEFFGPVALVIRVQDAEQAIAVANDSPFGLGSSVWTRDQVRGEALARRIQAGCSFVNGMVKSVPSLPFGGVKNSGYGRELSRHGMLEFTNAKTLWLR
ncbi:MAG: NAD-dependent succinate-semialdehyde dehydrogenase [Chromatiales bacterium]|nr:NAD-dependent succinate-semialdehyde dehydrogenase [Chromatiales bacterium]